MRKIKNILRSAFVAFVIGCSSMMTSCIDYLTMYPANAIILENYWKTVEDVEAMVASCYSSLVNSSVIERLMIWGELRADNMTVRSSASNDLKYIVEANLLETNDKFTWDKFYTTINYCNLVLKYAPLVLEEDPDFTQGDLDIIKGEMYALRALCHFVLLRSFRDIPMSFVAMDADDQSREYPQYSPYEALDLIYADLLLAKDLCMKTGSWPEKWNDRNYARITKNAVYAMMADVSLWRAAFAKYSIVANDEVKYLNNPIAKTYTDEDVKQFLTDAITASDYVINEMNEQVLKMYEEQKMPTVGLELENNPFMLCLNGGEDYLKIYDQIFLEKSTNTNSYLAPQEVIFKLDFRKTVENSALESYYGYSASTGTFIVPPAAPIALEGTEDTQLWDKYDLRNLAYTTAKTSSTEAGSFEKKVITITKYNVTTAKRGGDNKNEVKWYESGENTSDWIFYRKTDVMLMKAMAHAYRNDEGQNDIAEAFKLVNAVNKRCISKDTHYLTEDDYKAQDAMLKLISKERLRELTFEGKRWYDLVLMALFNGSTEKVISAIEPKLEDGGAAIKTKMSSMYSLFCPIYEDELKVNPLLKQNPVFKTNDSFQKN